MNQTTPITDLPLPLLVVRDGRIVMANEQAILLTGYTPADLEQSQLKHLLLPGATATELLSVLDRELPEPQHQTITLITFEGDMCLVQLTAVSILYQGEAATLCLIPPAPAPAQTPPTQDDYTQKLLHNLLDMTLVLETDFTVRFVNLAITAMLGYTPEEIIGQNYLDLIDVVGVPLGDGVEKMVWPDENTPIVMRMRHKTNTAVYLEHILRDLTQDPHIQGYLVNARDVTQRIQNETERRYQAFLLDNIHDAVISTDRDGLVRSWNHTAERISGYRAAAVMNRPLANFLPDLWPSPEVLARLQKGAHWEEERTLWRPDGSQITVLLTTFYLRYVAESHQGVVIMAHDITERQRTFQKIRLLQAAVEASIDGITIAEATGDKPLVYVNNGIVSMSGYSREAFLGRNCRFLQKPGENDAQRAEIRRAMAAGERCQVILRNYRKDGSVFWNELTLSPIFDPAGQVTHFIGIQRNVTEQIGIRDRLSRQAQELASLAYIGRTAVRELNLNQVLNKLVAEISPLYPDGVAIFLAEKDDLVLRVAGTGVSESLGLRVPITASIVGKALQTQEVQWHQTRAETQAAMYHFDNQERDLYPFSCVLAVPLIVEEKAIGVLKAMHMDDYGLTEDDLRMLTAVASWAAIAINNAQLYETAQNALRKEQTAREQLIQSGKLAAMGRMVATVAHELNNPLQTIRNCLFLIQKRVPNQPPIKDYLRMSLSEVDRLSKLVLELREVYRPSHSTASQPVALVPLISDLKMLITPHLKQHGVRWDWQPAVADSPVCQVLGVADQLKQVFLNISLNAIESMTHNPEGGVLQVRLEQFKQDEEPWVAITFIDEGEGIEAAQIDAFFEPFYTTKETGMGLGLAISYDIIQRHDGRILVESEQGQGTAMRIELPLLA